MEQFYPYYSMVAGRQAPTTSPYGVYGYGTMPQQQAPYLTTPYPQQVFPPQPSGAVIPGVPTSEAPGMLPIEQSYIENILRLNKGKLGTFYFTYENNTEWNAKVYVGVIEAAGRDHIIISDPDTGKRYLLLMVNLDYVEFNGPINYNVAFGTPPTTIAPR